MGIAVKRADPIKAALYERPTQMARKNNPSVARAPEQFIRRNPEERSNNWSTSEMKFHPRCLSRPSKAPCGVMKESGGILYTGIVIDGPYATHTIERAIKSSIPIRYRRGTFDTSLHTVLRHRRIEIETSAKGSATSSTWSFG
jgi:hypothetical protein